MDLFKRWFSQRNKDTPLSNVWEFDAGKLVVLSVYLDVDLLVSLVKRYNHLTKVVSNYVGDRLFVVTNPIIKEVFALNTNVSLLEKTNLSEFQ